MAELMIKNMVCQRCIILVKKLFDELDIAVSRMELGEVETVSKIPAAQLKAIEEGLHELGFELITSRTHKIIDDIKKMIREYIGLGIESQQVNLSRFITQKLHYDYSYLSDLFSSVEGKTIEQHSILQRIEKVKELLVYDQLSLTEISYQTGFSSVHHLSSQFKKVTGLTPSHFKKLGDRKRKSIDDV